MRVAGRFPWSTMGLHNADCHSLRRSGSPCRGGCRVCEQLGALRLYRCQSCGRVALICSRCDRGQLYCAAGCAQQARRASLRRAGKKYQQTKGGKRKHAARMDQYRREQTQKVTHQGPPPDGVSISTSQSGASLLPAKKDSDVPQQSVLVLPPPLVPPQPSPVCAPILPSAKAPAGETAPGREHTCHFCGCTRSRLIRRDSVSHLRRRLAQKAARLASPCTPQQRSPP
jgi:hypothetical protein